ncbi:anti-Muellerian hormone type-2 receptor isoform 2-T2 [Anomaloglossus baeobatrachus]|uniref:anti-Muellerian hormone type-2 receptor isoform X2 n=1 Tax=Anomaloglossus baeobatrachus TaxID=238106 RepID=UPI003F4FC3F1
MAHTGLNTIIYLILLLAFMPDVHLGGISCALLDNASYSVGFPMAQFGDVTEPGKIHCNESKCCMGTWVISNGKIQDAVLGCFPLNAVCRSEICVPVYQKGRYQCLCSSDMCNANISLSHQHISWNHVAVLVAIVTIFLLLSILGFIIVRKTHHCLLDRGESLLEDQEILLQESSCPPTRPVEGLALLQGSLRSYLTDQTIDWDTACRMAISLARGLAFLHSDLWNGDVCKPAIAHRDLSSDNILVTADSSCVITDFGLSVVLENCQMKKNPRDPVTLNMTGTLRYMSPEMLDGSLNLKSWKKALTQADVYSLGLLMWEIFSRCNDLYADHQCPEFRVAFSDELGPNPTLNELQSLVVENKQRPIPRNWRKNLQLFETLWETLEDCWDPDSEARLTAQCAEQRLRNLLSAPMSLVPGNGI